MITSVQLRRRAIAGYIGFMSLAIGLTMMAPLAVLLFYPEELTQAWGFFVTGLGVAVAGFAIWKRWLPKESVSLTLAEGSVIVLIAWVIAIVSGAIPLLIHTQLTVTQAVFESTSGWTTTGLSVVDVTQTSHLILMYRSTIELVGGAGLAIVTLSVSTGLRGAGVSSAEGRADQLAPNVRRSAKLVLKIYSSYVAIGIVALYLAGMGWFDAVNHAFAALSTGGFSTRADSIGYWDNSAVEAVTIVLMLLGTLNFVTSYLILNRRFKPVFRNGELKLQSVLIPVAIALLLFGGVGQLYPSFSKGLRVSVFEAISALSTTGFSTVGYADWNSVGWLVMIVLMLIGGGAGSTAGGIKQARIYTIYRSILWEIKRILLPRQAVTEPNVWQGEQQQFLSDRQIRQTALLMLLYLFAFMGGCLALSLYGYPIQNCLFEMASTLSTVGLSVGVTAADAPAGQLWVQSIGMLLGRLEFITVFVGLFKVIQTFGNR